MDFEELFICVVYPTDFDLANDSRSSRYFPHMGREGVDFV
jgi:hypothetical protein